MFNEILQWVILLAIIFMANSNFNAISKAFRKIGNTFDSGGKIFNDIGERLTKLEAESKIKTKEDETV